MTRTAADDVAEIRAALADHGKTETPAWEGDPQARASELERVQPILNAFCGAGDGELKPTPNEIRDAIRTFERVKRGEMADLRGVHPDEQQTMNNGLRDHLRRLHEAADLYLERESAR